VSRSTRRRQTSRLDRQFRTTLNLFRRSYSLGCVFRIPRRFTDFLTIAYGLCAGRPTTSEWRRLGFGWFARRCAQFCILISVINGVLGVVIAPFYTGGIALCGCADSTERGLWSAAFFKCAGRKRGLSSDRKVADVDCLSIYAKFFCA